MTRLKFLIEQHTALKFPDFPVDDDFSEWVADLAEVDGYYMVKASPKNVTVKNRD